MYNTPLKRGINMSIECKIERLKKDIERLKKLYKSESNPETKAYYLGEICSLSDLYKQITRMNIKLGYKTFEYNQTRKFILQQLNEFKAQVTNDAYRKSVDKLCTNATDILYGHNYDYINNFSIRFSKNICIDIILDFINELIPNLYPKIKSILENRLFFLKGQEYDESYSIGNSHIAVYYYDKINFETLEAIIHELGHIIYSSKFVKQKFNKEKNNFIETLPYLFEQLFI